MRILKIIGVLLVILIVFISYSFFSAFKDSRKPNYFSENGKMYYKLRVLTKDLFETREIEGADPDTFNVVSTDFHGFDIADILSKDKNSVYIQESDLSPVIKIDGADPATIKAMSGVWWLQDKNHVYLGGKKVLDADPATFSEITNGVLFKDKKHVYLLGDILSGVDVASFNSLGGSYYADTNSIHYCHLTSDPTCVVVKGADKNTFTVQKWDQTGNPGLNPDFAFDAQHVFYYENMVEDADPKTFHKIGSGYSEIYKDSRHTYGYSPSTRAKLVITD
ncbi:MAG: DKNYY domain-containing protein [Candidatus Pacebacteria bacterium]|nr:DKNYY domain-containing protein [Candidatus Paceibacterota bacterium]